MNGIRVALVTRRFWPLAGSCENTVADLSQELLAQGLAPAIVTARFDGRWPTEIVFRENTVHRLPFPQRFGWGTMRYMIALSRWLRRNCPDIDLVYVSRLSLEAHATLGAFEGSGIPVVLRAEMGEPLEGARGGQRRRLAGRVLRRCQTAAAVVATSEITRSRLLDAGFRTSQVHVIPDGVAPAEPRTGAAQLLARAALAGVNEDLRVGLNMPVVTYCGPLQPPTQLEALVTAWRYVAREHPHARLWLVGDGALRERLYRNIRDRDLLGRVLMPGTFDDLQDVLLASDLLIVPPGANDQSFALLKALAAQLPVLVATGPEQDNLVQDGITGRRFTASDPRALARAILDALANPEQGEKMAQAACQFTKQHRSLREMAQKHQQLFRDLIRSSKRLVP